MTLQTLISLLASLCALGGVACLTIWSSEVLSRLRLQGIAIEQQLNYDRETNYNKLPKLLGAVSSKGLFRLTLGAPGLTLLPLIRRWKQRNVFQLGSTAKHLDTQLQSAGIRQYLTPEHLIIFVVFTAVGTGLMLAILTLVSRFSLLLLLFGFTVGAIAGFFAGRITFSQTIFERKLLIEKRLPFAVEFMLLAMESGTSFPSAMSIYCDEMKDDALADEFRVVLSDIDRGLGIKAALINLDQRMQLKMLSAFLVDIITGLETGQPVKAVLEVQADTIRLKRYQEAEQTAKTASTKAIFPMLLIVLGILLLLVAPLVISSSEMTLF